MAPLNQEIYFFMYFLPSSVPVGNSSTVSLELTLALLPSSVLVGKSSGTELDFNLFYHQISSFENWVIVKIYKSYVSLLKSTAKLKSAIRTVQVHQNSCLSEKSH